MKCDRIAAQAAAARSHRRQPAETCQTSLWTILALCISIVATNAHAGPPSTAERYIAGLRDRRFFQLATEYAEQQLTDSALDAEESLAITLELARTHAAWALNQPPATRGQHWQQANAVLARFKQTHADHGRILLIDLQLALNGLAHGELLRQEAEVGAANSAAYEPARQVLRQAVDELASLDQQLAKPPLTSSTWDATERLALRDQIRWQLARALRNQALCYAAGSADRVAALSAALDPLTGLMRELPPESRLYWSCRLDSAECQRLMEDYAAAQLALEAILAGDAPPKITLRARGELAEVHLARGDFEKLLDVLQQGRTIGEVTSAEFDLVYLKSYLALWKRDAEANKPNDAAAWLAKAEKVAQLMELTHGAYWRRMADLMLASAARGGPVDGNLDVLMRTADNLYVRKQYAEAIAAYSDAARTAEAADPSAALQLWKKAAAVHQQQQQPAAAAELLATATVRLYETMGAAEAHVSSILLAARAAADDPVQLDRYLALMAQHVEIWPASSTTNQVRLWQGRLMEHRRRWPEAIAAYTSVTSATAPQTFEAVEGAARAYQQQIETTADAAARTQLATEALRYFSLIAFGDPQRTELAVAAQAAAMQQAKFELQYLPQPNYRGVEQIAARTLATPGIAPALAREAESLLIVALAAQPTRRTEALQRLRESAGREAAELLGLLDQLASLSAGLGEAARREIAVLILEVCDTLLQQPANLNAEQRDQIQRRQAAALVAAGRNQEAIGILAALAQRHPRDAEIQESYAELLLSATDRTSLTAALEKWRWIGQHSPPDSQRWWRAKYHVALAHYRLGEAEQAAKIIRYAQATGAGKPDEKLAGEIEALLQQASGGR